MNLRFITPDLSDNRIKYAAEYLENAGFRKVKNIENADFILLGINPDIQKYDSGITVFAGNTEQAIDYTKDEAFAKTNAVLSAEAAVCIAVKNSENALYGSNILIVGYGRIGKALHRILSGYQANITVCARNGRDRAFAEFAGGSAVDIKGLENLSEYDYIFNTVPSPLLLRRELSTVKKNALIIELASFPYGTDRHAAEVYGLNLITAGGLPGKYSPEAGGIAIGKAVEKLSEEVFK